MSMEIIKEAVALARKYDNIELYQKLLTVEENLVELREENLKFREEIGSLNERLKLKSQIIFEGVTYWIEDDEMTKDSSRTPICRNCYDKEGKVFRLPIESGFEPDGAPNRFILCHNCKFISNI